MVRRSQKEYEPEDEKPTAEDRGENRNNDGDRGVIGLDAGPDDGGRSGGANGPEEQPGDAAQQAAEAGRWQWRKGMAEGLEQRADEQHHADDRKRLDVCRRLEHAREIFEGLAAKVTDEGDGPAAQEHAEEG
jgi:hypothetical protein